MKLAIAGFDNCYIDNNFDDSDTSFHGIYVKVAPADFIKKFGEGEDGDMHKVSQNWVFVINVEAFTVYDWKETSGYDDCLPSPNAFWSRTQIEHLHIGHFGHNSNTAAALASYIEKEINK